MASSGTRYSRRVARGVDVAQVLEQDVEVLGAQLVETQDRAGVVDQPVRREPILREPAGERAVGVEPAAGVDEEVRRAAEDEAEALGVALVDSR